MQAPMMMDETQGQQGQMMQQPQDEISLAKQALGLDQYEQQMQTTQTQMQAIQAQMQESQNKAMFNEISSANKDVDPALVQAELTKIEQANPQLAQMLRTTRDGLDMLFKKVVSEMKPKESPDEITDSGDAGSNANSDIDKKIKNGTASEVDLGDFILANA
ncbi:MAG: hypothetical protein AB7D43_03140 [Sulfurimonadaceae bacterium]